MSGFRDKGFNDRLSTAESARKAMQQRFQAKAGADDPAAAERRAARQAVSVAREARLAEREAAKLAEEVRETAEREARETAERELRLVQEAREVQEKAERQTALEAEQKAARDARYAARKARK
jgi:membrane protein involved in colicin uptake